VKKTLFALALVAAPFASFASESNGLDYTYVQLDGIYRDASGFYGTGAGLSGSYAVTDNVFLTGSYARVGDTHSWGWSDELYRYSHHGKDTLSAWTLGVGFNQSLADRADWVTQVAYVRPGAKWNESDCYYYGGISEGCDRWSGNDHASGYNVSTGVLGHVTNELTANAYLGYEDYNHHYDGNFFADFGVGYAFNKTWSLQTGVRLAEGSETWKLGVRASF